MNSYRKSQKGDLRSLQLSDQNNNQNCFLKRYKYLQRTKTKFLQLISSSTYISDNSFYKYMNFYTHIKVQLQFGIKTTKIHDTETRKTKSQIMRVI